VPGPGLAARRFAVEIAIAIWVMGRARSHGVRPEGTLSGQSRRTFAARRGPAGTGSRQAQFNVMKADGALSLVKLPLMRLVLVEANAPPAANARPT
jgi:hypothetical protein